MKNFNEFLDSSPRPKESEMFVLEKGVISIKATRIIFSDGSKSGLEYCLYIFDSPIAACSGIAKDEKELHEVATAAVAKALTKIAADSIPILLSQKED